MTDKCTFWETVSENLLHLFWECEYTTKFWKELEEWLNKKLKTPITLSKLTCLGLKPFKKSKLNALNHVLLLGKQFIYTCKFTNVKPKISAFEQKLKFVQILEVK